MNPSTDELIKDLCDCPKDYICEFEALTKQRLQGRLDVLEENQDNCICIRQCGDCKIRGKEIAKIKEVLS